MTELHLFVQIFEREQHKATIEATDYGYQVTVEDLHDRPTRFVFDQKGNFKFFTITP